MCMTLCTWYLWSCPFHRDLTTTWYIVGTLIQVPCHPKICHLQVYIYAMYIFEVAKGAYFTNPELWDKDVASCKVSVDKGLPSEVAHACCNMLAETEALLREATPLWGVTSIGWERGNFVCTIRRERGEWVYYIMRISYWAFREWRKFLKSPLGMYSNTIITCGNCP